MSNRWGNAHSGCPRCLVAMWLWHGTLLGVPHALRTSGDAFPFVIDRLRQHSSGTPSRGISTSVLRSMLDTVKCQDREASTRGCPASCTRGAGMPPGTNTVWGRMSEAHVHWVPSNAVMAIASRSTANCAARYGQVPRPRSREAVPRRVCSTRGARTSLGPDTFWQKHESTLPAVKSRGGRLSILYHRSHPTCS